MQRLVSGLLCVAGLAAAAPTGEEIYKARCASCHDQTSPRIPPKDALRKLPATRILKTLDFGLMMSIAYPLERDGRQHSIPKRGRIEDHDAAGARPQAEVGFRFPGRHHGAGSAQRVQRN